MDHPLADGPPDDPILGLATDAVRDEVGSKLCAWVQPGPRRICRINIGEPCLCRQVAEAALRSRHAQRPLADRTDLEISDEWERRFGITLDPAKCIPAQPSRTDALAGLDERLDRLLLTASDNNRFVLSTESAKNIVGIVREWLRRFDTAQRAPDRARIAQAICCPSGCKYVGDSEDGEKCWCDTSDFNGSGIEKKTDAVLAALPSTPSTPPAQCAPWQPIDTKPKDHFPVLVDGPYGIFTAFQDVNWTWFVRGADEPLEIEITHWMPLPARSALSSTVQNDVEKIEGGAS